MNTTTSYTESLIEYTPDAIDEYIVVVNLPEDWETVHNYIINENEIDGIPNRKINCSNIREFSLRTSVYEMSSAEADILKTHEKVESVGLNPEKYPQPQQHAVSNRFGQVVAFPKPLVPLNQGSYSDQSYTNNIRSNWAMLCADDPGSEPFQGVGITTVKTVDRDLTYTRTGTGVDVVIIDSGVGVLHPEFIAPDGTYRVRDVILDGPYKVDPAAFSGYTTTVTIDGVNIGTRAQEARALAWWSTPSIRSSAFQSLGTLSITSNYTRIHAHSENGTNRIIDGHGSACASQIGGKSFGHAFECNLWNIRLSLTNSGGFLDGETVLDVCTIFHNAKKAASSDPDPTLINNSFGASDATGNSSGVSYAIGFRGNNTNNSYTGSGSNGVPPSNAGSFRNNKYFRWMDSSNTVYNTPYSGTGQYLVATNASGIPYSNIAATNSSAEDAIAAGCIVVSAASNDNQKLSDKNDVDFNNWYLNSNNYVNRVAGVQQGFSGDHDVDKGSIRVGAIDCAVEPHDELQGATKYSLRKAAYSNNGPMVDIFAAAEMSMAAGVANYKSYQRIDNSGYYDVYFNGTSSACPNVCSVIALYLQSARGSNQSAVRQWLKTTASKSNLISDPYPNVNGAYYFVSPYTGNQYDSPTRPSESYNFRGCGNLRGAPNRILFNPFTTSDTTNPTLSSSVPADGATGVAVSANLVLNFSETVIAQSGKNIVIYKSDDSVVETISVTSGQVTGSNSSQVTVNPSSNLDTNTSYYVLIDSASFKDAAGNSYAGISDKTSLNFTTAASDTTAPTLVSTNPPAGATGVAVFSDVEFNFSEAVYAQSGNFVIYKASDNSVVETISVTSGQVTGSGTSLIRLNPTALATNTTFYIHIDSTAFDDAAGNSFAGISDSTTVRFTTGADSGDYSLRFFGNGLTFNGQLIINP